MATVQLRSIQLITSKPVLEDFSTLLHLKPIMSEQVSMGTVPHAIRVNKIANNLRTYSYLMAAENKKIEEFEDLRNHYPTHYAVLSNRSLTYYKPEDRLLDTEKAVDINPEWANGYCAALNVLERCRY